MRIDALAVFILGSFVPPIGSQGPGAGHVRGFRTPCPTAFRVAREGFSGICHENTKTRNESDCFVLSCFRGYPEFMRLAVASWTPLESIDSPTATVDNQGDMFLAATSLVLISVGINLPTITG